MIFRPDGTISPKSMMLYSCVALAPPDLKK